MRWAITAPQPPQKGPHLQFLEGWLESIAAENCIRYRGLGHKLVSWLGPWRASELWFSLIETLRYSQDLHLASGSQRPSPRGGQNPLWTGRLSALLPLCSWGGLEIPSRKVFCVKVMDWPWDDCHIFSILRFRKYLIMKMALKFVLLQNEFAFHSSQQHL